MKNQELPRYDHIETQYDKDVKAIKSILVNNSYGYIISVLDKVKEHMEGSKYKIVLKD